MANKRKPAQEDTNPFEARQRILRTVSLAVILAVIISGMGIALLSL